VEALEDIMLQESWNQPEFLHRQAVT